MKKIIFVFAVFSMSLFQTCCCNDKLCDLIIVSFKTPETIKVGDIIDVATEIGNDKDNGDCKTDIAGKTTSLLRVLFMENGIWDEIFSTQIDQDQIAPDGVLNITNQFTPKKAGDYKFEVYTDDSYVVAERNEDNNLEQRSNIVDKLERLRKTNNYAFRFVKVLPR